MKVSIITACFNSETTIKKTIESVKNQSYKHIEHIIQDGGSSDNTIKIIQENINENIFFQSEDDNGIYDGINKGILRAKGEIIGLLHADDLLASDKVIANIVNEFKNNYIDAVYGDLNYISKDGAGKVIRNWKAGKFNKTSFMLGWMPPHPTLYIKRNFFTKFGLYDTSYTISADYKKIIEIFLEPNVKITYIPEVLVFMTVGGASNKSLKQIFKKSSEDLSIIRKTRLLGVITLFFKNVRKISQFFISK